MELPCGKWVLKMTNITQRALDSLTIYAFSDELFLYSLVSEEEIILSNIN